jgi:hypothetical protein
LPGGAMLIQGKMKPSSLPNPLVRKGIVFTLTSGVGWLMSIFILWLLVRTQMTSVFWGSWIGDLCAVTYVYIVSVRSIFMHSGKYLYLKFLVWLIFQFFMINLIAYCTSNLSQFALSQNILNSPSISATCAKITITPLTLLLNFIFANFLLERVHAAKPKEHPVAR